MRYGRSKYRAALKDGVLHVRPHAAAPLACLSSRAEIVIWTRESRDTTRAILRTLDPYGVVSHCVQAAAAWKTIIRSPTAPLPQPDHRDGFARRPRSESGADASVS